MCTSNSIVVVRMRCFVNLLMSAPSQDGIKLQGSKLSEYGWYGNTGLPKARKSYGNGNVVVGIILGDTIRMFTIG